MQTTSFWREYLPYCLQKQKDGSWVVCNRNYKPVGFNTSEFIRYEDYPVSAKIGRLGPATISKLQSPGITDSVIYLHGGYGDLDDSTKAQDYFQKLKILAHLPIYR